MLEAGKTFVIEAQVTENDTAKVFGSGELEVLATPKMIALMEEASYKCVAAGLDEGSSTVGTYMGAKHLAATPVGMKIKVESTLTEVDGRRLVFSVKAYDECGLIGEGDHERFVIFAEKFVAKTYAKLNK
ncbi:MAG: thioesterase family protein [Clostridia bacterium]|nr:thioesterase family protein [Clostridia bacterium]